MNFEELLKVTRESTSASDQPVVDTTTVHVPSADIVDVSAMTRAKHNDPLSDIDTDNEDAGQQTDGTDAAASESIERVYRVDDDGDQPDHDMTIPSVASPERQAAHRPVLAIRQTAPAATQSSTTNEDSSAYILQWIDSCIADGTAVLASEKGIPDSHPTINTKHLRVSISGTVVVLNTAKSELGYQPSDKSPPMYVIEHNGARYVIPAQKKDFTSPYGNGIVFQSKNRELYCPRLHVLSQHKIKFGSQAEALACKISPLTHSPLSWGVVRWAGRLGVAVIICASVPSSKTPEKNVIMYVSATMVNPTADPPDTFKEDYNKLADEFKQAFPQGSEADIAAFTYGRVARSSCKNGSYFSAPAVPRNNAKKTEAIMRQNQPSVQAPITDKPGVQRQAKRPNQQSSNGSTLDANTRIASQPKRTQHALEAGLLTNPTFVGLVNPYDDSCNDPLLVDIVHLLGHLQRNNRAARILATTYAAMNQNTVDDDDNN